MTSDELAARCCLATARALTAQNVPDDTAHRVLQSVRDGILRDGREQYETVTDGETTQAFEAKTPTQVVDDMLEEARDLVAYGVMLSVRLHALRDGLDALEAAEWQAYVDTRPACPHCQARWTDRPEVECPACRKPLVAA